MTKGLDVAGIASPENLDFALPDGRIVPGASQEWYRTYMQRMSGCGPTTASMQLYYLARTREEYTPIAPKLLTDKEQFLLLMEEMFRYVTPGMRGVNTTAIYKEGAVAFAKKKGVLLTPHVLDVPPRLLGRPDENQMWQFLQESFLRDIPVAFLNLSNGSVKNLDRWHWVLLTGLCHKDEGAVMYDNCKKSIVDISMWLRTTTLGGGFVSFAVN